MDEDPKPRAKKREFDIAKVVPAKVQREIQEFAEYGRALRKDPSLTLNAFAVEHSGRKQNGFVPTVAFLEEHYGRLLLRRVLLEPGTKRLSNRIVSEWAELFDNGVQRDSRRINILTEFGAAITDYGTIEGVMARLYMQLTEQRPVPPQRRKTPTETKPGDIVVDESTRRLDVAEATAAYLAEHSPEFTRVLGSIEEFAVAPHIVLDRHADAKAADKSEWDHSLQAGFIPEDARWVAASELVSDKDDPEYY